MTERTDVRQALAPQEVERVESVLRKFLDETRSRSALLVDRAGHLVVAAGDVAFDQTGFASLAAADFAASGQLARLLGEDEFTSMYHRGAAGSMLMADVAGKALLAVLFDDRTTLGMVRLAARSAVREIAGVIDGGAGRAGRGAFLENGWLVEAEATIDRLFVD